MINDPHARPERYFPNWSITNYLRLCAIIFTIIGAFNWGLVGIQGVDLVSYLFGTMSTLSRIIYAIVGLSGVYLLYILKRLL
jgi:uncharacterized membrane protein YuzA (DUF378 family)